MRVVVSVEVRQGIRLVKIFPGEGILNDLDHDGLGWYPAADLH